eukprot:3850025-Prymnesium_polylepis.1
MAGSQYCGQPGHKWRRQEGSCRPFDHTCDPDRAALASRPERTPRGAQRASDRPARRRPRRETDHRGA